MKCITLDNMIYKDKQYGVDTKIDVDSKDINKLIKIGAVRCLEAIPGIRSKVEINVIKNPVKFDSGEDVKTEPKKIKRKYSKKKKKFRW